MGTSQAQDTEWKVTGFHIHLILCKTKVLKCAKSQALTDFFMWVDRTNRLIVGAFLNLKRIGRKEEPAPRCQNK